MIKELLLFVTILSCAFADKQSSVSYGAVASPNEFRAFAVTTDSLANSIALGGIKVDVDRTGQEQFSAQVDAAGFKFSGGITLIAAPQLGFSVVDYTANVQWTANANGNGSILVDIQGAFAEIGIGFNGIFAYKERNSKPGFQYNVGDPVFDCSTASTTYDCIIANSLVSFDNALTWASLTPSSQPCSSVLTSTTGYSSNCTIYQYIATGSWPLGPQVIQITLTLSNQAITVNGHEIGPDRAKFNIQINYPWTAKAIDKNTANVGLLVHAAGKAVSGSAEVFAYVSNNQHYPSSLGWIGSGQKATILAWDQSATLTMGTVSQPVNVYVNPVTGDDILAYRCPSSCTLGSVELTVYLGIIIPWQLALGTLKGLGWTPELVILSWDQVGADQVLYDPIYGTTASTDVGNSGMYFAPTIFLSFIWVFLVRFFYH